LIIYNITSLVILSIPRQKEETDIKFGSYQLNVDNISDVNTLGFAETLYRSAFQAIHAETCSHSGFQAINRILMSIRNFTILLESLPDVAFKRPA